MIILWLRNTRHGRRMMQWRGDVPSRNEWRRNDVVVHPVSQNPVSQEFKM